MPKTRVENEFHSRIWSVANDWQRCEVAITEARDICKALIDNPDEANLHNALAARWLVRFGA